MAGTVGEDQMIVTVAISGGTQVLATCRVAWREAGEKIRNLSIIPVSSILLKPLIGGIQQETRGHASLVMGSIKVSLLGHRSAVEGWRVDPMDTPRPSSTLVSIKKFMVRFCEKSEF